MHIAGRTAIVTGGGGGIGSAIAHALADAGARVVVADLDDKAAEAAAASIDAANPGAAVAESGDVARTEVIARLIDRARAEFGPVDMYFANAGIAGGPGLDLSEDQWDQALDVNLRAHIRAAQLLVPGWAERGDGCFVSTASAAGLLTQIGSAGYSVSKHAAVGFAEWLSVTYGDRGVHVACLCPMGVETPLLREGEHSPDGLGRAATRAVINAGTVLAPQRVAAEVMAALDDERFLILPHPEVLEMYRHKGTDYDRWLRGMRRFQAGLLAQEGA